MNLLVISQFYPRSWSHSGIFIHRQNIDFIKLGVDVTVITPTPWAPKYLWFKEKWRKHGNLPDEVILDGVKVFYLRYPFLKPSKFFYRINAINLYLWTYKFIKKYFFNKTFDAILARPLIPTGYSACLLAKKMNLPVVCEGTGSDVKIYPYYNRTSNRMLNNVLKDANKIIATSKDLTKDINFRAGRKICSVMYRGVNIEKFKPLSSKDEARKSLGIDIDYRNILFVGGISAQKGIYDLLAALKITLKRFHQVKLYLIGMNTLEKDVSEVIEEEGLKGKVFYMGMKTEKELVLWYNACDFLVLPSYSEGMPNVVFEAMACMKPVVATSVGGIPEVVDDNITGILVGVGEIFSLADAMARLLIDDGLAEEMGKRALEKVASHFVDTEKVIGPFEMLKSLVLEKGSGSFDKE